MEHIVEHSTSMLQAPTLAVHLDKKVIQEHIVCESTSGDMAMQEFTLGKGLLNATALQERGKGSNICVRTQLKDGFIQVCKRGMGTGSKTCLR